MSHHLSTFHVSFYSFVFPFGHCKQPNICIQPISWLGNKLGRVTITTESSTNMCE